MIERIMDEKNSLNEGLIKAENIMRRSGSLMQSKQDNKDKLVELSRII